MFSSSRLQVTPLESCGNFDPTKLVDTRERVLRDVTLRVLGDDFIALVCCRLGWPAKLIRPVVSATKLPLRPRVRIHYVIPHPRRRVLEVHAYIAPKEGM
jgi:hypothetical protein